jgi:hypothetical protein
LERQNWKLSAAVAAIGGGSRNFAALARAVDQNSALVIARIFGPPPNLPPPLTDAEYVAKADKIAQDPPPHVLDARFDVPALNEALDDPRLREAAVAAVMCSNLGDDGAQDFEGGIAFVDALNRLAPGVQERFEMMARGKREEEELTKGLDFVAEDLVRALLAAVADIEA